MCVCVCVCVFVCVQSTPGADSVDLGNSVSSALLPISLPLPSITVGPVIGRVTPTLAVVLLEVDRASRVRCSLTDVLSGKVYVSLRMFAA